MQRFVNRLVIAPLAMVAVMAVCGGFTRDGLLVIDRGVDGCIPTVAISSSSSSKPKLQRDKLPGAAVMSPSPVDQVAKGMNAAGFQSVPISPLVSSTTFENRADSRVVVTPGLLDHRRQFALGMIETANDDTEVGLLGEVSRYQIMPSVWKRYSTSRHYTNPDVSIQVARKHWASLRDYFVKQAGREPSDFDMYVMWNTRYGYYAGRGYDPARLGPVVRDRAQRFVNLVARGDS